VKKLRPGEIIVKEGTYLWAGTIECDICIVYSPIRYGSGDREDPRNVSDDVEYDTYYIWYGSTTERGAFNVAGGANQTMEDAMAMAEAAPGIGSTVQWKDG
jgi:hypothetical protein